MHLEGKEQDDSPNISTRTIEIFAYFYAIGCDTFIDFMHFVSLQQKIWNSRGLPVLGNFGTV